jgi:integrase
MYAGVDPLTGKRLYLTDSTTDEAEARRILTRFRAEVDEQRNARTRAVFSAAIAEWLKVHELEETTREGYEAYTRNYINPALGDEPVSKISARVLEQFYAELRRCRTRCDGHPAIDHRARGLHECRVPGARLRRGWLRGDGVPAAHLPAAVQCHDFEAALHHPWRVVRCGALGLDLQ